MTSLAARRFPSMSALGMMERAPTMRVLELTALIDLMVSPRFGGALNKHHGDRQIFTPRRLSRAPNLLRNWTEQIHNAACRPK